MSLPDRVGPLSVSIVIPAFNEETVIRHCLLAAVNQSVAALQIIVVDNGSTDGTCSVVVRMQEEYPNSNIILLAQGTERGIIPTRNFGLNQAGADVLGRIDADSVLEPDWVEQVQEAFADPDVAAATGPVTYYDMPLHRLGLKADDAVRQLVMRAASGEYPFLFGSNMAIRRSAWEQIRAEACRDELDEMHEDIDLSLHLKEHGLRIVYTSTMISGISARRLDDTPENYRYYVNRFERTYRAHHVHLPALKAPAIIFGSAYWPLKILRTVHISITKGRRSGSSTALR